MSKHTEGEYKGKPTLTLDADSKWPFTFGISKARMIVEHIETIKAFVAKHDKPDTKPTSTGN